MILLLLSLFSFANELPGEEIYVAPQVQKQIDLPKPLQAKKVATKPSTSDSNLPFEFLSPSRQSTQSELIQPPKGSLEILKGLNVGDKIEAYVDHSVIAFPDEKAPVVAKVETGALKNYKFIGESYLEKNSRRIFINFLRVVKGSQIFNLKAAAVTPFGQTGFEGKYHSREAEYFTGDFIASFAAGYFDGLVPRHTNAFGQIETDQTVDAAVKKGLASGALSTAERFKEKLKKVPEFSEIRGPFEIQILILDQAKKE